ncbi:MAG: 6-phosphogluconate dehydrogenase [Bacteroidota bacterium]
MKKFLGISITVLIVAFLAYFVFVYFVTYSEGYRSGKLVKISKRGMVFKTWEGTLSQGVSDELQFHFSVQESDKVVIEKLKEFQGTNVKLSYIERFATFPWLGDTKHYVKEVEKVEGVIEEDVENN